LSNQKTIYNINRFDLQEQGVTLSVSD